MKWSWFLLQYLLVDLLNCLQCIHIFYQQQLCVRLNMPEFNSVQACGMLYSTTIDVLQLIKLIKSGHSIWNLAFKQWTALRWKQSERRMCNVAYNAYMGHGDTGARGIIIYLCTFVCVFPIVLAALFVFVIKVSAFKGLINAWLIIDWCQQKWWSNGQ